jgi:hypothetical protein
MVVCLGSATFDALETLRIPHEHFTTTIEHSKLHPLEAV